MIKENRFHMSAILRFGQYHPDGPLQTAQVSPMYDIVEHHLSGSHIVVEKGGLWLMFSPSCLSTQTAGRKPSHGQGLHEALVVRGSLYLIQSAVQRMGIPGTDR